METAIPSALRDIWKFKNRFAAELRLWPVGIVRGTIGYGQCAVSWKRLPEQASRSTRPQATHGRIRSADI